MLVTYNQHKKHQYQVIKKLNPSLRNSEHFCLSYADCKYNLANSNTHCTHQVITCKHFLSL